MQNAKNDAKCYCYQWGIGYENPYFYRLKNFFPNGTPIALYTGMENNNNHNRKDAKMADFNENIAIEETTPHLWEDTLYSDCCYADLDNTPREGDMVICPQCGDWSEARSL